MIKDHSHQSLVASRQSEQLLTSYWLLVTGFAGGKI